MSKAANHRAASASAAAEAGGELSFEQAMERLEKVVQTLESEDLSLEALLKNYTEGVELARLCQQKLSEAELKIRRLEQTLASEVTLPPEPLAEEEEES